MQFPASLPPLVLALFLPGLALIFTFLHHARARGGRLPRFRVLRGVDALQNTIAQVTEEGRAVHVATGASRTGAASPTAETLASLLIAQRVAQATAQRGGKVAVTTGDVVAFAAARGGVRGAYQQTGFASEYQGGAIQMTAQQTPVAYAAGVAGRYATDDYAASAIVGDYGAEALLITEAGRARGIPQLAGATTLDALPVLTLSANATLIGEEVFAAEAYLANDTTPRARLLTQDALRRAVVVLVVLGVVYQLVNVGFGLGLPSF